MTVRVASISSPEIPKLCKSFARLSRYLHGSAKPHQKETQRTVRGKDGKSGRLVDYRTCNSSDLYQSERFRRAREAGVGAHGGEVLQHGGLRIRQGPLAIQRQGEGDLWDAVRGQQKMERTKTKAEKKKKNGIQTT